MTEKAKKIVETLKYCASGASVDHCKECTHVFNDRKGPNCLNRLFGETVALIESLSAQLDQVTRERDAAVSDFTEFANSAAICVFCKDFEFDKPCDKDISREDCWRWRGEEVEG